MCRRSPRGVRAGARVNSAIARRARNRDSHDRSSTPSIGDRAFRASRRPSRNLRASRGRRTRTRDDGV